MEIERFKRPNASETGIKLAVLSQVKKNPLFKDMYGELTKKNRNKIEGQSKKNTKITLGDNHSGPNVYQKNEYHDNNSYKREKFNVDKARAAKLVSLPLNMKGANCGNCKAFEPYQENSCKGHCSNPKLNMRVYDSQICRHWNNPDSEPAREDDR